MLFEWHIVHCHLCPKMSLGWQFLLICESLNYPLFDCLNHSDVVVFKTHCIVFYQITMNDCLCVTVWTCHSFLAEITQNAVPPLTPGTNQKMSQALAASFKSFEKEQQRLGIPKGTVFSISLSLSGWMHSMSMTLSCLWKAFDLLILNCVDFFTNIVSMLSVLYS